jgi:hypothetical protein
VTSARDVLETYAADIAARLPLSQRTDVARELLTLLDDELQARVDAEARAPDEAMARAVTAAFGDPAIVAAGYRPPGLVIIPPERASNFLTTAVSGVVIQWAIGVAAAVASVDEGVPAMAAAQGWFFSWGLGAFWWPGFIVMWSAIVAWRKARSPAASTDFGTASKTRGSKTMTANTLKRIGAAILLPVALFFAVFYIEPDFFVGRIAPWMNTQWITYTDDFQAGRLWALITYMAANVILLGFFVFDGFESRDSRRYAIATSAGGTAVLLWCALGGPALMTAESDKVFRFALFILALVELYTLWTRASREAVLTD